MTIKELLVKLKALFPASYPTTESAAAWAEIAQVTLGAYQGAQLRRAYERTMAAWTWRDAPKPADIAAHITAEPLSDRTRSGPNMRRVCEDMARIKPALIREWWQANRLAVDDFLSTLPIGDQGTAKGKIDYLIRRRAHNAAMCQAMGRGESAIEWTDKNYEQVRLATASQPRHDMGPRIVMRRLRPPELSPPLPPASAGQDQAGLPPDL